jgi:histidine triad (HIT) family protein
VTAVARRDWYCEDVLSGKLDVTKVSFIHPKPQSEIHVVVIPKAHVDSILDPAALDGTLLISLIRAIQEVAMSTGLDRFGLYVRTNAASEGVTPHMHWHIYDPSIQ